MCKAIIRIFIILNPSADYAIREENVLTNSFHTDLEGKKTISADDVDFSLFFP